MSCVSAYVCVCARACVQGGQSEMEWMDSPNANTTLEGPLLQVQEEAPVVAPHAHLSYNGMTCVLFMSNMCICDMRTHTHTHTHAHTLPPPSQAVFDSPSGVSGPSDWLSSPPVISDELAMGGDGHMLAVEGPLDLMDQQSPSPKVRSIRTYVRIHAYGHTRMDLYTHDQPTPFAQIAKRMIASSTPVSPFHHPP
jgi:hypothetical protein